jgi:hypothetical protein
MINRRRGAQFYSEEPAKRGMTVLNTPAITARSLAGSKIMGEGEHLVVPSGHRPLPRPGRWALRCGRAKRFLAAFILTVWAAGAGSRPFLGMHWPVDLLASIGLAFILTRPSVVAINRHLPPPGDNIL